jgi:hypothetical protein
MYWELKYQHGELRAQLQARAGGSEPGAGQASRKPPTPAGTGPSEGFVPLTSLRR